jgi:hypothetical protein
MKLARYLLAGGLFVWHLHAQNPSKTGRPTDQDEVLARPIDWGFEKIQLFRGIGRYCAFSLKTSWIPGERHKGMFRFIMTVTIPYSSDQKEIEALIKRAHDCSIYLLIADADGFLLRSLEVPFMFVVDDNGRRTQLEANSSSQMDASEYRHFLGGSKTTGSWKIGWSCPSTP